jgi:hypothetical protein
MRGGGRYLVVAAQIDVVDLRERARVRVRVRESKKIKKKLRKKQIDVLPRSAIFESLRGHPPRGWIAPLWQFARSSLMVTPVGSVRVFGTCGRGLWWHWGIWWPLFVTCGAGTCPLVDKKGGM